MSKFDEHLLRYNFQPFTSRETIRGLLNGTEYQGVISESVGAETQLISGLLVDSVLVDKGINEEYLNTPITGKHVFASKVGGSIGIPCYTSAPILVQDDTIIPADKTDFLYKEVVFTDEATVADIYKNAWRYRYDDYLDAYVRLPEQGAKQQLAKYVLAKEIANMAGSPYDRLADYGRIILYLLSKISLSEAERTQLAPLLAYAPTLSNINEVLYREKQIQERVNLMKENFNDYIGFTS